MVLTVSFVVSPETGLFCLRRRCNAKHCYRLDTSVGVSGRYDFAVRFIPRTPCEENAATAPCPAFVAIASRPSLMGQDAQVRTNDLPDDATGKFQRGRVDFAGKSNAVHPADMG
jgi:hypothetical protein